MCRVLPSSYAFHNYLCYQHCDVCGRQNVQPQSRTAKHSQRVSCPSSDSQSYPNGCQLRHIPWILWMYGANNALVDADGSTWSHCRKESTRTFCVSRKTVLVDVNFKRLSLLSGFGGTWKQCVVSPWYRWQQRHWFTNSIELVAYH